MKRLWMIMFLIILAFILTMGKVSVFEEGESYLPVIGDKFQQGEHPYGNPVKGPMPWEFKNEIQKVQAKYGAYTRLSAFKADLPDPLPGEHYNIAHAADLLKGSVVKPGQIFSMNNEIGPYTEARGFKPGPTYKGSKLVKTMGGGVCKIASLLYNLTILADLKVIERWSHSMQVPYVPPGQDATVYYGVKDYKFKNNTQNPVLIWADTKGETLYMAFYGRNISPEVKWYHQILSQTKYKTIYYINKDFSKGEEKVIIPGSEGLVIKSWVKIKYSDEESEIKNLGKDHYKPMNRVVEKGKE